MLINMGPQHPSTHGVLRLVLRTDGEVVTEVTPQIGYLHRCGGEDRREPHRRGSSCPSPTGSTTWPR